MGVKPHQKCAFPPSSSAHYLSQSGYCESTSYCKGRFWHRGSWYGWSAQAKLHWIMPIIGTGIFGFGTSTCVLICFVNHVMTGAYQEWWPHCVSEPSYLPKFILITSSLPIQLYLVDSFVYAASAVSAASVSRLALFYCYHVTPTLSYN